MSNSRITTQILTVEKKEFFRGEYPLNQNPKPKTGGLVLGAAPLPRPRVRGRGGGARGDGGRHRALHLPGAAYTYFM